ncbi:uncharacterized protein [Rutidosis leptorrhynchoides]|uniref:uncharacterized protein n=1 Tax=Rutidosis leptorrhynchoides TaxID=125765 RepID=UPI003A994B75
MQGSLNMQVTHISTVVAEQLSTDHNVGDEEIRKEVKALSPDDSHIFVHTWGIWRLNSIIQRLPKMLLPSLRSGKRVSCFNFAQRKYKWRLKQEKLKKKANLCVSYGFSRFRNESQLKPDTKCFHLPL